MPQQPRHRLEHEDFVAKFASQHAYLDGLTVSGQVDRLLAINVPAIQLVETVEKSDHFLIKGAAAPFVGL